MIHQVCEGCFKSQPHSFSQLERLRHATRYGSRAWPNQASNGTDSDPPWAWNRIEGSNIEILIHSLIRRNWITDTIWTKGCASKYEIQIRRVETGAGDRSQVRSGLQHRYRAQFPTAKDCVTGRIHMAKKRPVPTERQLIDSGKQETLLPRPNDISPIITQVEAICHGDAIGDLWRERGGRVAGGVAEILGPGVISLEQKAMAHFFVDLRFQRLVVREP